MMTIDKPSVAKVEIKKSQFIAHLIPIKIFDQYMQQLKEQNPKARHFVWATRTLNEHKQIEEYCSDDGEPKNTSGKPTLKVLQGGDLIETALITVRYFGGVKLGTGGLVRAYNQAGQEAVSAASLIDTDSLNTRTINIPYNQTRQIDYHIEKLELSVLSKDFDAETVTIKIQGESARLEELHEKLK
ncbi:MAG: YigZ family protein [Denitrovibrio sp.]|nr:MAG: YigZ family protein [Denitrovibrio sp.]